MRFFLLGFMGTGKTTVGKLLAEKLKINYIDLDDYIEEKANRTIKHIFEWEGEEEFRKIERDALVEVLKDDGYVLSVGGGTSCFFDNMEKMKNKGITIYLKIDVDTLVNRLLETKHQRPLLWGKSKTELNEYILTTLEMREKYYSQANILILSKDLSPEELVYVIREKI